MPTDKPILVQCQKGDYQKHNDCIEDSRLINNKFKKKYINKATT